MFHRVAQSRIPHIVAALALLTITFWRTTREVRASDPALVQKYDQARRVMRELLDRYEMIFPARQREQLQDSVSRLTVAGTYLGLADPRQAVLFERARADCDAAMTRLLWALDESGAAERLAVNASAGTWEVSRFWPSGNGAVILRIARPGAEAQPIPEFVRAQVDLAAGGEQSVEVGAAQTVYAVVFAENAPAGIHAFSWHLLRAGNVIGTVHLELRVPPTGTLEVTIRDENGGQPTAAAAGVYASDGRLQVPEQALSFDEGGFRYAGGRVRPYHQARFWPGLPEHKEVFFANGKFSLKLPAGDYKLIAAKGMEYRPAMETVSVAAGTVVQRDLKLRRWINMPARGWFSGDGHVHYARADEKANQRLLLWTKAEDVHLANCVRMGDALQTYFEQYAFGTAGRYLADDYAIVAGQEDPRTTVIGHTLQLNIQNPVRFAEDYYSYDRVFDEIHRQRGLTGYAHVYQPEAQGFFVGRDMSVNVARRKIDFAEIAEFGDIDDKLYSEFLNLGFPLTASAGSDVPWGNTIGTARVYVHTGARFTPDAWFEGLQAGRTFVTVGPMLEFSVNGRLPGTKIQARRGDKLHIQATASGTPVPPRYVEIVEQGDVIHGVRSGGSTIDAAIDVTVRHSTWIAARCAGALTTPVYVQVGDERFWDLRKVEDLIARRLRQLDALENLESLGVAAGREGTWNNPEGLRNQMAALRERSGAARRIYHDMLEQARRERQSITSRQ
jgi:hypothetical protein